MAMVNTTKPSISHRLVPCNHCISPSTFSLNKPSCDKKITIAKPFTNPIITGCGIKRTNLPKRNTPAKIWMPPTTNNVMNSHWSPRFSTGVANASPTSLPLAIKCTITTAMAPVAPEIIPGLPPNSAVTIPIINAP